MQPFTATVQLADRAVTVRELAMSDFRKLLFASEIAAAEADTAAADPVADDGADPVVANLADTFLAGWLRSHLAEKQISLAFILGMSTVTEAELMQARFTEIDALISKIKALNAPFFALLRRLAGAAEPTSAATAETPIPISLPAPQAPTPEPPPTSASALSDPLAHSLDMAMQAHGTTAT